MTARTWLMRAFGANGGSTLRLWGTVLLVLVPMTLVGAFGFYRLKQELTDAALTKRESVAYLVATVLKEKFDRLIDVGISLATRVRFRQLIERGRWNEAIGIMQDVPGSLPFVERLFLTDPRGALMADTPALPGVRGQDFSFREWYQGVSRTGAPYISDIYERTAAPRINVVAVAIPVKGDATQRLGILVMQIKLDVFAEWFKDASDDSYGVVYIVDRKGQAAFHPHITPRGETADLSALSAVSRVLKGHRGIEITRRPDDSGERVMAYAPVAGYGWAVILDEPAHTAFAARAFQLRWFLVIYGLLLLLSGYATYLLLRTAAFRRQAGEEARLKAELERLVAERTAQLEAANRRLTYDIDWRKKAQEALERYAHEVEDLYNQAPCGYHSLDVNGVFQRINDTELGWLGYARDDVVGKKRFADVLTPDSRLIFERNFPLFKQTGAVHNLEFEMVRRDGSTFLASLSATAVRDDAGNFVMSRSTVFDITSRKQADAAIRSLNTALTRHTTQLEHTNKELEAFSYSVSHDLRAPLRAIDGFSQALLEEYNDRLDGHGRDYLRRVRAATQRMGGLIDDMLMLSRVTRSPMRRETVDLGTLAGAVVEELRRAHPRRRVDVAIGPGLVTEGDPKLLRILIHNLLANAWKFTSQVADARIEIGCAHADNPGAPVFYVRDNGAGFDMTYADKLFMPFQRLHKQDEFPGTGIGLAIVQRVVNRHGGRVRAEGAIGGGATFYFELPAGSGRET